MEHDTPGMGRNRASCSSHPEPNVIPIQESSQLESKTTEKKPTPPHSDAANRLIFPLIVRL